MTSPRNISTQATFHEKLSSFSIFLCSEQYFFEFLFLALMASIKYSLMHTKYHYLTFEVRWNHAKRNFFSTKGSKSKLGQNLFLLCLIFFFRKFYWKSY